MINVVLVDENDNQVGVEEKVAAHLGEGKLHRAFSILVFNENGETLVTQRSAGKMLWPLVWDSACASHPFENEGQEAAGERRLTEELGFTCKLENADTFQYHEKYQDIGAENEICAILVGDYNGHVHPNPEEVADYKWMAIKDIQDDMAANPDKYTIWFKIELDRLIAKGRIKVQN
ncbi:MAG: isopentenyl-diphosphate Delta-isomerase [Candidatus Saccharibacteria bacterium]|nr:isopentenyl-diphosphate Delta-isomerase [Candidatus Saccharibacteria bacterium]